MGNRSLLGGLWENSKDDESVRKQDSENDSRREEETSSGSTDYKYKAIASKLAIMTN